jgi:hypothetical protein
MAHAFTNLTSSSRFCENIGWNLTSTISGDDYYARYAGWAFCKRLLQACAWGYHIPPATRASGASSLGGWDYRTLFRLMEKPKLGEGSQFPDS